MSGSQALKLRSMQRRSPRTPSSASSSGLGPLWIFKAIPRQALTNVAFTVSNRRSFSRTYRRPPGLPILDLMAGHWGRLLSGEVIKRFCETLDEAPQTTALLNTPEALLRQIEGAVEGLDPAGELVIVLAGDWRDVLTDLSVNQPDGYQLGQQNPEDDQTREIARYNGHPILRGPARDDRRLYIVEPEAWGSLVRAKTKGDRVIVVKVNPVSAERARALLDSNPQHFAEEPDEISKLRKLKTCVEITVSVRAEFRVTDPSRARRIVSVQ